MVGKRQNQSNSFSTASLYASDPAAYRKNFSRVVRNGTLEENRQSRSEPVRNLPYHGMGGARGLVSYGWTLGVTVLFWVSNPFCVNVTV